MVETWISKKGLEQSAYFKRMIDSMSSLDLEEMAKHKKEAMMKKIEVLQGSFDVHTNTDQWNILDFDDSKWPQMKLPGLWEQQNIGLEDLDGVVWFRKTIIVDDADAGKPATIDLSKIGTTLMKVL